MTKKQSASQKIRCPWAQGEQYIEYHDLEWGVPIHDDRLLFEFLILEGAQAGLSWVTILKKRENYRTAFDHFDPAAVAKYGKFVSGFGHRFHPVDPRAPRLLELVDAAAREGHVGGRFAAIARGVEAELAARKNGKRIPMNIDGATAVIYAELGFPAPLARGLFCLSRSVGILAHAWEQTGQGGRNKGPIPRQWTPTYDGQPQRPVPDAAR